MSKPLLGLILGAILGLIDGACAYLYPEETHPGVREGIIGIVVGSTFKGLVTGVVAGWVATKKDSIVLGIVTGLVVGGLLSYAVAAMGDGKGNHYYWEIIPPGMAVGVIVGFCTQKYGLLKTRTA
ncbi:MAG: hypothetical protein ACKVS6_01225 [Planctomycetota bacterium]